MSELATQKEPSQQDLLVGAIKDLFEVQAKDTEVKKLELDVRLKEIESNEKVATLSINAQERSYADNREKYNKHLIHRYFFIGSILIIVAILIIVLIYLGAKDIVLEAMKIVGAGGIGAFGGYYAGKAKKESDD